MKPTTTQTPGNYHILLGLREICQKTLKKLMFNVHVLKIKIPVFDVLEKRMNVTFVLSIKLKTLPIISFSIQYLHCEWYTN